MFLKVFNYNCLLFKGVKLLSVLLKLGHMHEDAIIHVLTRLVLSIVVDKVCIGVEQVQNDRMVDVQPANTQSLIYTMFRSEVCLLVSSWHSSTLEPLQCKQVADLQ